MFLVQPSFAHIPGRPDLDAWAMGLQNGNRTICCSFEEARDLNDAEWDTTVVDGKSHYRVYYKGRWLVVDDSSVVYQPNKYGPALAWIVYLNGEPWVKCFLPGTGT